MGTILLFFAVLFVLILVHEWGHFIVAKKTGMRVDEFGIGFPPKLVGIKRGETEYTLNALPIGGFVRIFGEDAEGARESGDYERSFIARPKWAQALVLIAGVSMNILFAWLLFVVVLMIGAPTMVEEESASPQARLVIEQVIPDGPADQAGVPAGATILSIQSGAGEVQTNVTPSSFRALSESSTEPLTVTYTVGGEEGVAVVIPVTGLIVSEPDRPVVGVSLAMVEIVRSSFLDAIKDATIQTYQWLVLITVSIASLLKDAFVLEADLSAVAGPVGIVGLVGDAAAFGFTSLLLLQL
jgi:regulator of sigma E protease